MINAVVEKAKGFLLAPTKTFQETRTESLGDAFRYYVVLLVIFTILYAIVSVAVGMVMYTDSLNQLTATGMFGSDLAELLENFSGFIIALQIFFVYLLFLVLLIGVFLDALFYHVFVILFGGEKGFVQTIKTMMYAATPWFLLGWIPYISIIGGIWALILFILGIKENQEMTLGRAILAVLVPIVLILILFILGAVVIGALFAGIMEMIPLVS
jgi:hypothetical protein